METAEHRRTATAAVSTATTLGLRVDDSVVLHDSNKLTLRLLPCDVVARVAPAACQVAELEIELAGQLAALGCPVAVLNPRVEPRAYECGGFVITLWTYYEPTPPGDLTPATYCDALQRLHAGMLEIDVPTPHFTDRVAEADVLLADPDRSPALARDDRQLLRDTLSDLSQAIGERGRSEQLLHGEPHAGNVLATKGGLLFIDLEACCRGPVEFDLSHAPEEIATHYPGVDQDLLRQCRILALAMITAWRWDRADHLPNGRRLGKEWLAQLRVARG